MSSYHSTRGLAPALDFEHAVLAGLASDGGLYVPENLPAFTPAQIAAMRSAPYSELAFHIVSRFTEGAIAPHDLRVLLEDSYREFRHAAVAPLKQLGANRFLLELFHGPTLAFKDFALQFLGRLMAHLLARRGERITIVGATSGDTGSAAIAGCAGRGNMEIFILHPKGRVSEVQRRQMTSVLDPRVHNIALEGTFDDCQNAVKALFADQEFRQRHKLAAVNSINWARIVAQIVYYFYAALHLGAPARAVSFAVPTGNFGDIYAGYLAKRMGLPIDQLIIATNRNDILARAVTTGVYGMEGVTPSLSPSMDIQISSNFERLLFDLHDRDGAATRALMAQFQADGRLLLSAGATRALKAEFSAARVSDEETTQTIAEVYRATGELIDPHTAVGYAAGLRCQRAASAPLVVLATAHPAKFPAAVTAATGLHPKLPPHLADLPHREERCDTLPNDLAGLKAYITAKRALGA